MKIQCPKYNEEAAARHKFVKAIRLPIDVVSDIDSDNSILEIIWE